MARCLLVFVVWALSVDAWAGPAAGRKAMAARAEAQDLVDAILRGEGNLNAHLNRVARLEQQGLVALELNEHARRPGTVEEGRRLATALATLAHPNGELGLLQLSGSDDGATRMAAVTGLGRLKSKAAGPRLLALLGDPTLGVRKGAARALGALGLPKYGAPLLKASKSEGEVEVRAEMLVAVGACGDRRLAAGIEAYLDDSSESARLAAARALCLLGHKRGFDFARKRLASSDRYERIEALKLLEGSKASEAVAVLGPLLEDMDHAVAAMAARILYQGGDAAKLEWLVLKAFQADGDDKLLYERELETLRLADDQRRAILAKAGIR